MVVAAMVAMAAPLGMDIDVVAGVVAGPTEDPGKIPSSERNLGKKRFVLLP